MTQRVSKIAVERGLYALRYVRSSARAMAPSVLVRPAPGSAEFIGIVSAPHCPPGVIDGPGGCVVVRAERPGQIEVTVQSARGSDEAELRLDLLSRADAVGGAPQFNAAAAQSLAAGRLQVVGHVSRRGDVTAADGVWIAGPDAPAPIEGLTAILVGTGADLHLEYQVQVSGQGGVSTEWFAAGQYAGTKGGFRPLVAIRLRLSGRDANRYALSAEALFLGAMVQKAQGQQIELTSASKIDPLVGLKLSLVEARSEASNNIEPVALPPAGSSERRAGRVRVFRASGIR
ncbi:hypothetical protein ACQVP2_32975 [Methylobacterium aquaticum]|uniref:hypothetical protein n=1 Tax=Methylobacterium aquaticum TaxID=270351 RepID=UPI003D1734CF